MSYGSLPARRGRIHYPAAVDLVMLRGNAGRDIFFDESDRLQFYTLNSYPYCGHGVLMGVMERPWQTMETTVAGMGYCVRRGEKVA